MAIVLAYQSAWEFWRTQLERPAASEMLPWPGDCARGNTIRTTTEELQEFASGSILQLSLPLQLLYPSRSQRIHSPLAKAHVCTQLMSRSSLCRIGRDLYVVSPEWCYLQMATQLGEAALAELGSELCANFAFSSDQWDTLPKRSQLTTPGRLRLFCNRAKGSHGRRCALAAIASIRPKAESPMEITSVLLYCLSRRLGGYRLPNPQVNERIVMGSRMNGIAPTQTMRADLRWKSPKTGQSIIVEVNSRKHHADSGAWYHDSIRNNALTAKSNRLYILTTPQLVRLDEVERLARILSRDLGVRLPPKTEQWQHNQWALHRHLTDFSRWNLPLPLYQQGV